MTAFNKQELLSIAKLSALKLEDKEIDLFEQQIKSILAYVDQLQQVPISSAVSHIGNSNIFREDVAVKKDSTDILAQAPETDENYFTVPKILDEK
jgi:aspartyl-tRNA(Asn)/glutamyl-tRNA(Gln) amidotransferase subunit C